MYTVLTCVCACVCVRSYLPDGCGAHSPPPQNVLFEHEVCCCGSSLPWQVCSCKHTGGPGNAPLRVLALEVGVQVLQQVVHLVARHYECNESLAAAPSGLPGVAQRRCTKSLNPESQTPNPDPAPIWGGGGQRRGRPLLAGSECPSCAATTPYPTPTHRQAAKVLAVLVQDRARQHVGLGQDLQPTCAQVCECVLASCAGDLRAESRLFVGAACRMRMSPVNGVAAVLRMLRLARAVRQPQPAPSSPSTRMHVTALLRLCKSTCMRAGAPPAWQCPQWSTCSASGAPAHRHLDGKGGEERDDGVLLWGSAGHPMWFAAAGGGRTSGTAQLVSAATSAATAAPTPLATLPSIGTESPGWWSLAPAVWRQCVLPCRHSPCLPAGPACSLSLLVAQVRA